MSADARVVPRELPGQMDDDELEEYDLDDNGEPTDSGILRQVGGGSLVLSTADPEEAQLSLAAYLQVDWDQEHGLELECDVDLDNGDAAGRPRHSIRAISR